MSLVNLAHVLSHLQNASQARLGLTSVPYTKLHLSIALLLQKEGFFSSVKLAGPVPPASSFAPGTRYPDLRRASRGTDREAALAKLVIRREHIETKRSREGLLGRGIDVEAQVANYATKLVFNEGFASADVEWAKRFSHLSPQQLVEEGVEVEAMGLTIANQPLAALAGGSEADDEGVVTQANRASRRLWLGLKYWSGEPVLRKARLVSKPTKRIWLSSQDLGKVVRGATAGEVKGMAQIGEVMAVTTDKGIMEARECVERRMGGQPLARFW